MLRSVFTFAACHIVTFGAAVVLTTWLMAMVGAAIAYVTQHRAPSKSVGGYFRFCFPAAILKHPSCRTDLVFIAVSRLIGPFAFTPLMVGNLFFSVGVYGVLTRAFGAHPQNPEPFWTWAVILAVVLLVQDFMTFYLHYLMHKLRPMWEIHKTHHSVEFLVPLSNRRFHPIQQVFDNGGNMAAMGLIIGASSYAFSLPITDNSIIGLDAYFILNLLSFHHLRHSHVYLSYGWLERYLMSPAQHQLHHSCESEHWDKNFGLFLSCWDRLWGTIVYSRQDDEFRLGLPQHYRHEYDSVTKLYVTPLRKLAGMGVRGLHSALTRRPGTTDQAAQAMTVEPAAAATSRPAGSQVQLLEDAAAAS